MGMPNSKRSKHPVLRGRKLILEQFSRQKINSRYLGWLSEPIVNYYSRRRNSPVPNFTEAIAYMQNLGPDEDVFSIIHVEHGHVGNIGYGPIDWDNSHSQIGIMIGEQKLWSQGIGTEAVYLVTKYLFTEKKLHRVEAGTANVAFVRLTEKLGWTIEGTERDRFRINNAFVSETIVSQLDHEFRIIPNLEPKAP